MVISIHSLFCLFHIFWVSFLCCYCLSLVHTLPYVGIYFESLFFLRDKKYLLWVLCKRWEACFQCFIPFTFPFSYSCHVTIVIVNIVVFACCLVHILLQKEDLAYQHQFILHAALDVVQDLAWTTNAMWVAVALSAIQLLLQFFVFLHLIFTLCTFSGFWGRLIDSMTLLCLFM